MTARRLAVWCVVVLLLAVPVACSARPSANGLAHHATLKSPRLSPGGGRPATLAPGIEALVPVLAARRVEALAPSERPAVVDPPRPFHPPRA